MQQNLKLLTLFSIDEFLFQTWILNIVLKVLKAITSLHCTNYIFMFILTHSIPMSTYAVIFHKPIEP